MRHLTDYYIRTALHRGKPVEQFLGGGVLGELRTIRYLELRPDGERFCLTFYEHIDEGSEAFLDVYEFSYASPDDDPVRHSFDTIEQALTFSEATYAADATRWVNQFVIQDEYADYLRSNVA
jgi:hypothetical protein